MHVAAGLVSAGDDDAALLGGNFCLCRTRMIMKGEILASKKKKRRGKRGVRKGKKQVGCGAPDDNLHRRTTPGCLIFVFRPFYP